MSMYNMLFGTNPLAGLFLAMLGNPAVPRFRDCYLDDGRIAVHTRTGGGNRAFYESQERREQEYPGDDYSGPWNSDLRQIPGFTYDADDDFDCTYATFYFKVPDQYADMVKALEEISAGQVEKPADRWKRVLDDLDARRDTPETKQAISAMRPILDAISEALSKKEEPKTP